MKRIPGFFRGTVAGAVLFAIACLAGGGSAGAEEVEAGRRVSRSIPLAPGENWLQLSLPPEVESVEQVFGRERLPSGPHAFASTMVSWHGPGGGAPTNSIWLDAHMGWQFVDGGEANGYAMPRDEGFLLVLPPGATNVALEVEEWWGPDRFDGTHSLYTLSPSGAHTMVRLALPEGLTLTNAGLREAGFTGAPAGEKVNPNNSDELRILAGAGSSLEAPRARILMDGKGHFVYWSGGAFLGSAEEHVLEKNDVLSVHTARSTSNLLWRLPFAP